MTSDDKTNKHDAINQFLREGGRNFIRFTVQQDARTGKITTRMPDGTIRHDYDAVNEAITGKPRPGDDEEPPEPAPIW